MIPTTRRTISGKRIDADTQPTPYQVAILAALSRTGKHVYAGTVSRKAVRRRRAARKARR